MGLHLPLRHSSASRPKSPAKSPPCLGSLSLHAADTVTPSCLCNSRLSSRSQRNSGSLPLASGAGIQFHPLGPAMDISCSRTCSPLGECLHPCCHRHDCHQRSWRFMPPQVRRCLCVTRVTDYSPSPCTSSLRPL